MLEKALLIQLPETFPHPRPAHLPHGEGASCTVLPSSPGGPGRRLGAWDRSGKDRGGIRAAEARGLTAAHPPLPWGSSAQRETSAAGAAGVGPAASPLTHRVSLREPRRVSEFQPSPHKPPSCSSSALKIGLERFSLGKPQSVIHPTGPGSRSSRRPRRPGFAMCARLCMRPRGAATVR